MRLATPLTHRKTVRVCHRGRMKIYIDIDGPLIRNAQPTAHCFEFLRWAVEFHRPYWLTTRDAHGQHTGIPRAFRHAVGSPELPAAIETLLRAVRPTEWIWRRILCGSTRNRDFARPWLGQPALVVDTHDGLLRAVDVIRAGLSAIEV
jgi:hypothetical protein